jgi:hypothetical protein
MKLDTNTENYLKLFQNVQDLVEDDLRHMEWLDDVMLAKDSSLELYFREFGLPYPDFPEATSIVKRTILINNEKIHAKRYTLAGLLEYVGYFAPIGVTISVKWPAKKALLLDVWGGPALPSVAMLATVDDPNETDGCYYLYSPQVNAITISMPASVSNKMKEFFETTIPNELPFGGDDTSIQLNFVYV